MIFPLFIGALVTPALFAIGGALISVPIIIHLLNKRKFKIVEWAAMDFLMQADKMNRRRIQIEDLILLALRCLAVLLLGLLVARPFLSDNQLGGLLGGARFERYVLLDDSLSMLSRSENVTPLDDAKKALSDWLGELSTSKTDEALTLVLASRPDRPLYNGQPLNDVTISEITETISSLKASDQVIDLAESVRSMVENLETQEQTVNRSIYVFSDMRKREWSTGADVIEVLGQMNENVEGVYVADVAHDETGNLVLRSLVPSDKAIIAGVPAGFDVVVENTGTRQANDVEIQLVAGESIPLKALITSIPAGETASVSFSFTFPVQEGVQAALSIPVTASISPRNVVESDRLLEDNKRFFAVRVLPGVPTLLVDGDPSIEFGRSETFYLKRAMAPRGAYRSGIAIDTVSDTEFDTVELDDFQVIYLCNVYRLSEERVEALEAWIQAGGGLVVTLGDQVDPVTYNRLFHREGKGFFQLNLEQVQGDDTEQEWVGFGAEDRNHPVLSIFEGDNNPLLEAIKVFRYWGNHISDKGSMSENVNVLARFTDDERTPALVEYSFGEGRVVIFTTPLDIDWSNWPREAASYLIIQQELARYMARSVSDRYVLSVGDPIVQAVDLAEYQMLVSLLDPSGEKKAVQALKEADRDPTKYQVVIEDTNRRGFYSMVFDRNDQTGQDEVLYAANVDPGEGELERVDAGALERNLEDKGIHLVKELTFSGVAADGPTRELWPWVLGLLVVLLLGEQAFACYLGRSR